MADTVTSNLLVDKDGIAVLKITNQSDSTGENDVQKLDLSSKNNGAGNTATKVRLIRAFGLVQGFSSVRVHTDRTSDTTLLLASNNFFLDLSDEGGFLDPGSGGTGDVHVTTTGATTTATYDITLVLQLE